MDPEAAPSPKMEAPEPEIPEGVPSPGAGDKRRVSDGEDAEPTPPSPKKPRRGAGDLGRVAEIVLVLSAMGRMRGGRDPTEVELGLMAEAREKLAAICETLQPKDIVGRDAVGRVIEDLGLNGKARDQRLGFKVPKLSIAEKLAFTRRKMEESKKYPIHTTTYMSHPLQGSFSVGTDNNRGTLPARTFQSDKPSQPPISAGGILGSPSLGNVASSTLANFCAGNSTSMTYHFGPSEARTSTISSALPVGHSVKDSSSVAVPKVEGPPDVVEIGSIPSRTSIVQGTSVVQASSSLTQPSVNAPTWPVQAQPTSLNRVGPEKNVLNHTPGKVQEASSMMISPAPLQAARDQTRRQHITRAASGPPPGVHHQPLQGVTAAAPSNYSNHYEIAKIVQKFLPPKLPEHPTWTPPSREYMNKALACQICQITINDVESVLLCDACEKGYHLKCLQSQNQRGIPKVEWHCQKCLALSHGKPLPPKYGRVMRNMAAPKVTANASAVQSSSEKKVGTDSEVNQQKVTSIESSGSHNPAAGAAVSNNHVKSFSDVQLLKGREMQGNNPFVREEMQEKPSSQCAASNSITSVSSASGSPDGSFNRHMNKCEPSSGEARPDSQAKSETPANESELSSSLQNPFDKKGKDTAECAGTALETCENSNTERKEAEKSYTDDNVDSDVVTNSKQEQPRAEEIVDTSTGSDAKGEKSCAEENVDSNAGNNAKEEKLCGDDDAGSNTGDGKQEKSREDDIDSNTRSDTKQDDADAGQQDPGPSLVADVAGTENTGLPSDVSDCAQWLGDVLELADGKAFYGSCCIAGVTYTMNQHALFHSDNAKLVPSKLQAMWEDQVTGLKWVKANRCYFPSDLPDNVGRPFTETNEVFESNREVTFVAGTIRGPCEVLHPTKYKEETERRSHEGNVGLTPVFLCKWFYDETKGHFQAVSS
ncbi:uncharacterized protein LOC116211765 isoform X1 [Punica granatum]|uniref:Uncharacterized protein LOC116211765 isoform X1 n=1 Tax=Punica granatum TaxID=22663 RepID=A0A6P8DX98_PUNGR|nr:uncharacterized protein LOC116211765 isoform X1 [Punica granatum]XP_031402160.1 uncharacterized protein LOC116211765 isoform X1 [Punica granatum]